MIDAFQVHLDNLAPFATKATESRGRLVPEPPSATRSDFQRDRDRIIHSGAFRKLRNKTQVFIENQGDYYRTRLTHSLEVAQIARSVARYLQLDEDLTEAVALAHDIGHTCFGHAGEDGMAEAMQPYGGFAHNEQTFRILTKLEQNYARFDGLNLTWETLEGVVKHNGPVGPDHMGPTLREFAELWDLELTTFAGPEAQIAAIADDIAYNTHDVDDGFRAGLFDISELNGLPFFGKATADMAARFPVCTHDRLMHEAVREVIGVLVADLLTTTQENLRRLNPRNASDIRHAPAAVVALSAATVSQLNILRKFLLTRMYRHEHVNTSCDTARKVVKDLFAAFMKEPTLMPPEWQTLRKTAADINAQARMIADYIAGMTDRFAIREHRRIFNEDIKI